MRSKCSYRWFGFTVFCFVLFAEISEGCRPPSIDRQGRKKDYILSWEVKQINCEASGDEPIVYSWLKNDQPLDLAAYNASDLSMPYLQDGKGDLRISGSIAGNGAYYQCLASNRCGTSVSDRTVLLQAYLDPFIWPDRPPVRRVQAGTSLTILCQPPHSVPDGVVTWTLRNTEYPQSWDDLVIEEVTLNDRIVMDYDGNLHITNVHQEDEQRGMLYICQIHNAVRRSISSGEDTSLRVQGDASSAPLLSTELMWASPSQVFAISGKQVKMMCIFSGNPQPTMTWTRDGASFDDSRMMRSSHELIINDVQPADVGNYTCSAENGEGQAVQRTFSITEVFSTPSWVNAPSDVSQPPGQNRVARFDCRAVGNPTPVVRFYINGRPFEEVPQDPSRSLVDNVLEFRTLTVNGSLVVQCNASNAYGYIWSDNYLQVQADPLRFIEMPPDQVKVAEGQTTELACRVQGHPSPTIRWLRNGSVINGGRINQSENGDLRIQYANRRDEGNYTCVASNDFSSLRTTTQLLVRSRTVIIRPPIDVRVFSPHTVMFDCGAITDPAEMENIRYTWLRDGIAINPGGRYHMTDGQLFISDTVLDDTGNYTCNVTNGLDSDSNRAFLRVTGLPSPPANVQIQFCNSVSAEISWRYNTGTMGNGFAVIKFIVESQTEVTNYGYYGSLETAVEVSASDSTDIFPDEDGYFEYTARIPLAPYSSYRFRVRAVSSAGQSAPSPATVPACQTPPTRPQQQPQNVRTDERHTGFLVVQWDPMNETQLSGPGFQYTIQVSEHGAADPSTNIQVVHNYSVGEFRLPVNTIYRPYDIQVRASNDLGESQEPAMTVIGYSGEGQPQEIPQNLRVDPSTPISGNSATLLWDAVNTGSDVMQGQFTGYVIECSRESTDGTSFIALHYVVVADQDARDNRTVSGTVRNLPGFTRIRCVVKAKNRYFASDASNPIIFQTPESLPGPVSTMEAVDRSSHHLFVSWTRPQEPNGIILGYRLTHTKINGTVLETELVPEEHIDIPDSTAIITDLDPDSEYRVTISARSRLGIGPATAFTFRTRTEEEDEQEEDLDSGI